MEVPEFKEKVEHSFETKVKLEENSSSVVYEVQVTSKKEPIDIKTKDEDPPQSPHNLITKVEPKYDSLINALLDQEASNKDEEMKLEVAPESEVTLTEEYEIDGDTESESDEDEKQSSTTQNRNISKKTKSCVKNQESKLQCSLCPKSFPWVRLLITHARKEHATNKNSSSDPTSDDESSTQCPLCPKSLVSVDGLQGHFLNFHIKNKPFQCTICLESTNEIKKFPTKAILQRHISITHNESRFRFHCDLCPRKFSCSFHYQNHKDMHMGKTFKCEYCSKNYRKKERMLRHIIAVHKEYTDRHETLKCDFCDQLFCSNKDLEYHVLQTHVEDTVQCKICFKKFLVEGELIKHLTVAHKRNRTWVVCDVCSKVFQNNKELVEHLEVEHKRFFKCRKCFRSFDCKEEYDSHTTEVPDEEGSNPKRSQFQCKICFLFYNTECSFTTHKDAHLNPSEIETKNVVPLQPEDLLQGCPLKCDFCPKIFAQKYLLKAHAKEFHPNEKWECKSCEKSFQLKYQLTQHEKLHSTKPFECQVCHKCFTNVAYLRKHGETHKEEKKYKCSQCEKTFALKPSLRLHIANHHGAEKPFKCHICEKSFAIKTQLKLHLLSHTEKRPFGCDECPGFYKCLKHLRNHKRKIHGGNSHHMGDRAHYGPQSIFFKHLVFVCSNEECDFESKDEKEVAIHNSKHGVPKIMLPKLLPNSSLQLQVSASKFKPKTTRTIRTQYKCNFCSKLFGLIKSLVMHTKTVHEGQRQGTDLIIGQFHLGPRSKYAQNLVFVCRVNECGFETKDETEVAVHYAKHGLPKVILSSKEWSSITWKNKRTIQARYKCKECSKTMSFPRSLRRHTSIFHGAKQAKKKKSKYVVSSSDEDEM